MGIPLDTDRLVVRRFTGDDAEHLVRLHGDGEVMRYLNGGTPVPRTRTESATLPAILAEYEEHPGFGAFATEAKPTAEFLGWVMLVPSEENRGEAELGYRFRRAAWGHGYATEAARAMIGYGFTELAVDTIFAETMAVNTRSRAVLERLGLEYRYTFQPPFAPIPGSEHGEVRYDLTRERWGSANQRKYLHPLS